MNVLLWPVRLRRRVLVALLPLVLAACGGGESPQPPAAAQERAAAAPGAAVAPSADGRRRALAVANDPLATTEVTARRLLDLAEQLYPQYFPDRPATQQAEGFWYRFHPSTGMYVGVRNGEVYVLGGPFGNAPVMVGPVTAFLTPQAPRSAPCVATAGSFEAWHSPQAVRGRQVTMLVAGCNGPLERLSWRQTQGPTVSLVGQRTQVLSFDPPAPGVYAFEVSFEDPAAVLRKETFTVQVDDRAVPANHLTLRAAHAVREGGKVSLRAWPTVAGETEPTIAWTQIDGPVVTLDRTNERLLTFTAPPVSRDTLLRFRATMTLPDGRTGEDEVAVLVERHVQAQASDFGALWAGEHVSRVHPFRTDGRYANALVRCVYDTRQRTQGRGIYSPCPLSDLPFLAQDTQGRTPTVEQVMDRVVVSNDWLGHRFEAFLRAHDGDGQLRRMMNGVTAIVLGTHVRPSFYWAATGAIYLDADNFWMTPEERDSVNEVPDFRSDFGNDLAFRTLWRYVKGGARLDAFFDPELRVTRTLDDVRNDAISLMYHELGHALDFLPPQDWPLLVRTLPAWPNIAPRFSREDLPSDAVSRQFPLTSAVMAGLAQVQFRGVTATTLQRSYTPQDVAAAFAADRATDDYSYSSTREDAAMTLEETLMAHLQGARRDVAVTDPFGPGATSATIIVRWGQRGRVGEASIRPRARLLLQEMTPWVPVSVVDQLPPPLALRPGVSWRENLADPTAPNGARMQVQRAPVEALSREEALERRRWASMQRRMPHMRHLEAPPQPGTRAWAERRQGATGLAGVETPLRLDRH
jgi:hypothetical protein